MSLFSMNTICILERFIWRKNIFKELFYICFVSLYSPSILFLWMTYCNYWVILHNTQSLENYRIYSIAGRDELLHLHRSPVTAVGLCTGESIHLAIVNSGLCLKILFRYGKFMKTWHAVWKCYLCTLCFTKCPVIVW